MHKTFGIYTLGCKLNFSESGSMLEFFYDAAYKQVHFSAKADVYLINTCSVTANANKKSRNAIARASKTNPDALIIVTGCYAQLSPSEMREKTGVDYVIGMNEKDELRNILQNPVKLQNTKVFCSDYKDMQSFFPSYKLGNRTRAFLKIQDGCDYFCSYCTIPYARGRSRNQSIADTIQQIKEIAKANVKEIVLTGVNVGDFGKSTGESFQNLLKQIVKIDGIERYRIGSIEPDLLDEEIIKIAASEEKIMPHFHLPLQSGSDDMLKLMRRKYDTILFQKKTETIKKILPNAFIGTDVITGVNGETEQMFEHSYAFLKSIDISDIHVFSYSERPGTKAVDFNPKPNPAEKRKRAELIKAIAVEKKHKFFEQNKGLKTKVLLESSSASGKLKGFSENYININTEGSKQLVNKIVNIEVLNIIDDDTMSGKIT
jgi:threonylcarbamoyladenosine tRNA methylthiotransferase MtaB